MLNGGRGGILEWLMIKDLKVVWPDAQRPLSEKRVKAIVEAFDPDLFDPPHVTAAIKEDMRHIIDGDHRVAAAERFLGTDQKIPCIVHKDCKTEAQAARIFRQINSGTARKAPTPVENFKVAVIEGSEFHVEIDRIVTAAGYRIASAPGNKNIRAVAVLLFIFTKYGARVLKDTLMIIRATWGPDPNAVEGPILSGYGGFLFSYPKANLGRLKERIAKKFTPGQLLVTAKAAKQASNKPLGHEVKQILLNYYNSGRIAAGDRLEVVNEVFSNKNNKNGVVVGDKDRHAAH
jgi:ParB-like nuclease domain